MKIASFKTYGTIFLALLKRDLYVYFKYRYFGNLIDKWVLGSIFIFIKGHVLPEVGLSRSYGSFFAISIIAATALWDSWGTTTSFVADIDGKRTIDYYLTLPIPATLYFIKQLCYFAIRAGALSLTIIPLAKIILGNSFDLSMINLGKSGIIFALMLFFCATISFVMSSIVKSISNIGHVTKLVLLPMFSTGGAQYSWLTAYSISPLFAYVSLANPLVYATEGLHAAMLGQKGYLPFWICVATLSMFTILIGAWAIRRMKKRLDCV